MERIAITIVGPTCSGKTSLGIMLAESLESEIISADSRQIYKQLSIGTAKPTPEELKRNKHHFIDFLDPEFDYNISRFEIEGLQVIEKLLTANKTPIIVGGSGLYVKALVEGIFNDIDTDQEYRKELHEKRELHGNEYLHDELKNVDPVSAEKMLPQNWKRIMRALEVYKLSGKPIWEHHQGYKRDTDINFVQYGLLWDRDVLYTNIENRVDQMITDGLIKEVEKILALGYKKEQNSLNTVGYKEIIAYLEGETSLDRAIELIKRNTRRFAKRQMTWFRKDDSINWISIKNIDDIQEAASTIITKVNN